MSLISQILKRSLKFIFQGVRPIEVKADIHYMNPNQMLKGKNIVITGGGRGLGYAMAKKFVAEGANVLISGRNVKILKESANKIGCYYLTLDVQDIASFDKFLRDAEMILGNIDCLVNNAGISLHEPTFFDVTADTFNSQIDTNIKGPFFLTQQFVALLKQNNRKGNILFISSETGDTMDIRPYGMTKVAVNSFVQGLAYLLVKDGIRVNAIAPGITASDMTGFDVNGNLYYSGNTSERIYLPEEVAEVANFLLSDASSCMSGQVLVCNNAKTINARWK